MKKLLFLVIFYAIQSYSLAQDQIAIKLSPGVAYSRINTNPDTLQFTMSGMHLRGKVGGTYDLFIKENYYVSSGIFWLAKSIVIKNTHLNVEEHHALQYIQLPIFIKLYTGEISLDMRLYAELGIASAFLINTRVTKLVDNKPLITKLRKWELSGLIGVGIEYNISLFTSLFAGISYQPGLSSVILEQDVSKNMPKISGYTDLIVFEIGIRF